MTAEDLMLGYCQGNQQAFRALYQLAAPRLLGYLQRLCRDPALASDLLQITFMKVHQSRATYVRGADPFPWLFTIAQRSFLDAQRQRKRSRLELSGDALPEIAAALDGGRLEEQPEERAAGPGAAEIAAALARLPASQREAVVLTKFEGKSVAEAAAAIGSTPGAVKLRAHRAYESLRTYLKRSPQRDADA